jgi:hypothetical protein
MNSEATALMIDLSAEQRVALRRAAINGDYNLFLGAGASRDSLGRDNLALPGSKGLIDLLGQNFGVPVEQGDLLWRIYDRAVEAAGAEAVYAWLRQRFWRVQPPAWMEFYARTPWATVWTLNLDDTFEASYQRIETAATRRMRTLNWDDDFRQGRELNVVHLHGVVDRDDPRALVFSLAEYAASANSDTAWQLNFRDVYGTSPFVIIGARLRDEPDIESVVSGRHPTHAAPTFYVSPEISDATATDLRRWNMVPVRMNAEDFALEWAEMTGLELDHTPDDEMEWGIRLGRQVHELKEGQDSTPPPRHDFLGGDEPVWADIESGLVADLDWIRTAQSDFRRVGETIDSSVLFAFVGPRLTGRSAGLLLLAQTLQRRSWRTFMFNADERPDVDAIIGYAASGKSIALMFDGFVEIADDIDQLLGRSRAARLNVLCIGVEDSDREANILGRISVSHLAYGRIGPIRRRLTGTDAAHLVDTLDRVGRLGFLEAERVDNRRVAHFRGQNLFDSMAQLENAPGFGRRVADLVNLVKEPKHLRLVSLAALASKAGHTLLAVDAARAIDMTSDSLVRLLQTDPRLGELLSTDGKSVTTRHRWMALERSLERLGPDNLLTFLGDALRKLSLRLSLESQRERNATSVLVGTLMSHRFLNSVFPGADLDPWYANLQDLFGDWSGRYWEQRAIVARRQGTADPTTLSRAESFSIRATELRPDSYSYTTLGTVLLAKAAYSPQVDVATYYERALAAFETASGFDSSNVVGWMAYLRGALPVLARLVSDSNSTEGSAPSGGIDPAELLSKASEDWARLHGQMNTIAGSSENIGAELRNRRQEYERIMRGGPR